MPHTNTNDLVMPTTGDLILKLATEHPSWSNGKLADEVRRLRPDARTTAASVSSTKSRAKVPGAAAETGRRGCRRFGTHFPPTALDQDSVQLTTNDLVLQLSEDHPSWSNEKVAQEVRRRKPDARTTAASVSSTESRAKASLASVGTGDRRARAWIEPDAFLPAPHDIDPRAFAQSVRFMIESGESAVLEFKSTARCNRRTQKDDRQMTWSVVKTIAAFMNTDGGTLLIGIDDAGRPVGIEEDYSFTNRRDRDSRDSWELWLTTKLKNALGGPLAVMDLSVKFCVLEDRKTIACIDVRRGKAPVFALEKAVLAGKERPREIFFVRLGNSTEELSGTQMASYLQKYWAE